MWNRRIRQLFLQFSVVVVVVAAVAAVVVVIVVRV